MFSHLVSAYWSLAIEEQFYLFWPLVVMFTDGKRLLRVTLLLTGAALLGRIFILLFFESKLGPMGGWTFCRIDSILVGGALAIVLRTDARKILARFKLSLAALATGIIILQLLVEQNMLFPGSQKYAICTGYTVYAIFFAGLINLMLLLPRGNPFVRIFDNAPMRFAGRHSYCIYIIHIPLSSLLWAFYFTGLKGSYLYCATAFFAATVTTSLLVGWMVWHLFEKHFLALKNIFSAEKRKMYGGEALPG